MNTVWDIINKPYVIALILAVIITLFTYLVILKKKSDYDDEPNNNSKICIYTFIISYFGILVLLYVFDMLKNSKPIQTGGGEVSHLEVLSSQDMEGLEMTGEDVDIGILENA